MVPIEAMASGSSVIVYEKNSALETVLEQKTGIFFHEPTEGSLLDAVSRAEKINWDVACIREHARQFDVSITRENLESFIMEKYQEFHRSLDLDINGKGYRKIIQAQVENQVLTANRKVLQSKIQ